MWLKLDQSFFGLKDDLYICSVYIPPINSPHYNQEYEGLESEISTVWSKGKKNLMGDFNSRVSEGFDFVVDDNDNENIVHILPADYK